MSGLLSGKALTLLRGDRCLFSDLDFALDPGELLIVEGQNGSGKTSLLRAIAGILDFESGEVLWRKESVRKNYQAFRSEMVWLSHKVGFKGDLTLVENLKFEAGMRPTAPQHLDTVLQRLNLSRLVELPFRALSAGQQRRVALARMLLAKADLWIMDEPFTNLDTAGRSLVVDLIREHTENQGLCLVASHQNIELDTPVKRVTLR